MIYFFVLLHVTNDSLLVDDMFFTAIVSVIKLKLTNLINNQTVIFKMSLNLACCKAQYRYNLLVLKML